MIACENGLRVSLTSKLKAQSSNTTVDGVRFYRAPQWAPNVIAR